MSLEKEILKLRLKLEKETNKDIRKILLEQKKELENMREQVGSLYMKYGNEGIIEMKHIDKFNEIKKIEKEIVKSRNKLAETTIAITSVSLLKSYVDSYYKTANIIDKGVDVGYKTASAVEKGISININYKLLRPEFVDAVVNAQFMGQNFSDRIWKNHNKLANRLYDVIGRGITKGTNIQKLSKEIKDAFGTSSFEAQRLVRDQMARVVSEAQDQIYQDNSDIINELLFVATLDDRTSETCQGLDGNRYKLTDNYPKIPEDTHIMCRSCYVPVVEGWSPRTRRDNTTKENIPYTDYKSWKKDN